MTTEIALRDAAASGTLSLTAGQTEWTPVQQAALAHIGIAEAPVADQQVFMHVCQRTGLDPFNREIYMIPRKESGKNGQPDKIKWTIQTGIDGFRTRAEEHPQYAGTLDPEWCGPDGVWRDTWTDNKPPVMARVKVLRHDRAHPISLPVRFSEFAATNYQGDPTGQWRTKPAHMTGKVGEAASLRKAFPKTFAGLFTDDEMTHLDNPARPAERPAGTGVTAAELTGRGPVIDAEPVDAPAGPEMASAEQTKTIAALFREAELGGRSAKDRDARAQLTTLLLRREVDTSAGLTAADAHAMIEALTAVKAAGHPDGLAGAAGDLLNEDDLRREARSQALDNLGPGTPIPDAPTEDGQA